MNISLRDLQKAVTEGILQKRQAKKLWDFLREEKKDVVSFRFIHLLYYLGGLIAISAVTVYITTAWERVKGFPLLILATFLIIFGFGFIHYFLQRNLRIPAGIMAAFTLALVPLIVFNIQFLLGYQPSRNFFYTDFHSYIDWYWVVMELATLLVGVIMLYVYRLPFLVFPVAVILWYMSMDFWPLLFGNQNYDFAQRAMFTMWFGIAMLLVAFYVDFRSQDAKDDYAFWLYLFGTITFWCGLSSQSSDSEFSKFIYFMINVVLLFIAPILNRRVFAVFGVLGILAYLSHLTFKVFANSLSFPIILVFIGVLIILAAATFTRMEAKLNRFMKPLVPPFIREKWQ